MSKSLITVPMIDAEIAKIRRQMMQDETVKKYLRMLRALRVMRDAYRK